jgi:TatD DNase family protein
VWASIGIHPHEAEQHADLGEAALLEAAAHARVIGIGESGLDYYYDKSDRAVQRELFRTHIGVARETGLPIIIHTRDAEADARSKPGPRHCAGGSRPSRESLWLPPSGGSYFKFL